MICRPKNCRTAGGTHKEQQIRSTQHDALVLSYIAVCCARWCYGLAAISGKARQATADDEGVQTTNFGDLFDWSLPTSVKQPSSAGECPASNKHTFGLETVKTESDETGAM